MGERVAVDRSHVHPKGVRVRRSTVMVHGCEPNCPAMFLRIFKLFSCEVIRLMILNDAFIVSPVPGSAALPKEEHWYMHTLSAVVHRCVCMVILDQVLFVLPGRIKSNR